MNTIATVKELILKNRSYRIFDESVKIPIQSLLNYVDIARMTMSSVNMQPLKYYISYKSETNAKIRPHTRWAGLLKDFDGPGEGQNPAAYIVVCVDKEIYNATPERFAKDVGIAAQTIMLAAAAEGFGGCMIGNFDRDDIACLLNLPESWQISLVLALGKPAEEIILEEIGADGSSAYYRDKNFVHHVPKRKLCDIVKYE